MPLKLIEIKLLFTFKKSSISSKRFRRFILYLIVFIPIKSFGQLADSNTNKTLTINQLNKLSKNYQTRADWFLNIPQFNYDSAIVYFDKAIKILEKNRPVNHERLAEIYLDIAKNMDKAFGYVKFDGSIDKAKEHFSKINPKTKRLKLLEYRILIQEAKNVNTHGGSATNLDLMVKAAAIIQNDSRADVQAELIRDKAKIYLFFNSSKVDIAFPYLRSSEKKLEEPKNSANVYELFWIYADLSWYYNVTSKNDSAQLYYGKIESLLSKIKKPILLEYYYSQRANNYMRQKKYDLALPLLKACENVGKKYRLELSRYYLFNLRLLGIIADENKNYHQAISYFQESLKGSLARKNVGYETDCYFFLKDMYTKVGDYKKAFEYQKKYAELAIAEAEKTNEKSMRESELQFSVLQKDQEISKKQTERNLYLIGLVAGLLMIGLLYRNFRIKQKSNAQLETLNLALENKNHLLDKRNAENELLLKEIHHRVKNNLEVVSSLLALQSAKIDDPQIQDAMLASQNRVQSMGILHQKLYQSEHLAFIEMKNYFQNLCENILDSYNETDRIKVNIDMNEIELDVDTAIPIGLIVNELLTNSLKYAFPKGEKGNIKLSLENVDKENFTLKISDNGVGKILNSLPKGTGFGTQLVDLLTRQIDGKLVEQNENGTVISINFKRQNAA
ncbi:MAG: histidine kinase dimerization/phosphoacceptor domain -containing protein [Bacteroidota bacterium]